MCWVALDRAIGLADLLGAKDRVEAWTAAREEIRAAILEHGWSEEAGAFTQAFGGDELDASNLMLAITGFLPGDDPRMKATIDATAARLTDDRGLVYRYRTADGLEGEEGTWQLRGRGAGRRRSGRRNRRVGAPAAPCRRAPGHIEATA
jgi:GH15 family glucan-1,4-alpha-glucosidase